MAFNCGKINFVFDRFNKSIYNTKLKLISKLAEESQYTIDPNTAISEWFDNNYESANKLLDLGDKKKIISDTKYEISQQEESNETLNLKETESNDITESENEDDFLNIEEAQQKLFGGNQLLKIIFENEFISNATFSMLYHAKGDTKELFLNTDNSDLNISLFNMRKGLYLKILNFLTTTLQFNSLVNEKFDGKFELLGKNGNVNFDSIKVLLDEFLKYLNTNKSSVTSRLQSEMIVKINDRKLLSTDLYSFLDAVYSFLGVKYFDTNLKILTGDLISINPDYKDSLNIELGSTEKIETGKFDREGNERLADVLINKYSFGSDRSKLKIDWANLDAKNAVLTVAKYTENLVKILKIKNADGELQSDKVNVSFIGQSWNGLVEALLIAKYNGDLLDSYTVLKNSAFTVSENPIERITLALTILNTFKKNNQFLTAIFNTGKIDLAGINVLLSIHELIFSKENPRSLASIENKSIYKKKTTQDGNVREILGSAGIMPMLKVGLIASLMLYMSPANYLLVRDLNGTATVQQMEKNTDAEKHKYDHIDGLNLTLYKTSHSELTSQVDGSQGVEVSFNYKNTERRFATNSLNIKINGVDYLALVWSHDQNSSRNIFGSFTSMTLHRKLNLTEEQNVINYLNYYGIDASTENLYSPNLSKRLKERIQREESKPDSNLEVLNQLKNISEQLQDLIPILNSMDFGKMSISNILYNLDNDEDILKLRRRLAESDDESEILDLQNKIEQKIKSKLMTSKLMLLKEFLQFGLLFLELPFLSQNGALALSYAKLNTRGLTIGGVIQSAIRSAAVTKIVSDFYENLDTRTPDEQISDFYKFYNETFGSGLWQLISDNPANIIYHGNGMNFPNRLPINESWLTSYFVGDSVLNNKSLPSTTLTSLHTRVANYRNNSVAASYLEDLHEIQTLEYHPAHNNLFVLNMQLVQGMTYDTEIQTLFDRKTVTKLSKKELIYHHIKHLFFDSFATTGLYQVLPTVVADKVSIPLYGINGKMEFKLNDKTFNLETMSIDDIKQVYRMTTVDYLQKLSLAVLNKFIRLFKFAGKLTHKDFNSKYGWDENFSGSQEELINNILLKITKDDFDWLILNYNKKVASAKSLLENNPEQVIVNYNGNDLSILQHLDLAREQIESNLSETAKKSSNKELIIENKIKQSGLKEKLEKLYYEQNGISDHEMAIAPDADYRIVNGKYTLHELIYGYKNILTSQESLNYRFDSELQNMISMLLLLNIKFEYTDSFKSLSLEKLWTDGLEKRVFEDLWIENGNLVLAKTKDGKSIYNFSDVNSESQINPMFKRYFYMLNLLSSNLKLAIIGNEIADPDKTSGIKVQDLIKKMPTAYQSKFDGATNLTDLGIKIQKLGDEIPSASLNKIKKVYTDGLIKIISACESALNKRNSIIPATEIPMMCNTINGIHQYTKIAIADDLSAIMYNIQGETDKIDAHDGSALRTPEEAILENGSLGDLAVGYELAKTIWHYKEPETGRSMLGKWAVFTLTNAIMHNSLQSDVSAFKIYKKMTNLKWDRDISLCHSRKLQTSIYDTKTDLNFKQDILAHLKGGLYYQEGETIYRIDDLNEFSVDLNKHIYITTESTKASVANGNSNHYCAIIFDNSSNSYRIRSTDAAYLEWLQQNNILNSQEALARYVSDNVLNSNKFHTCNSNFELNSMLGGINSVNNFDDNSISEQSHFATAYIMNNVIGKVDLNQSEVTQDRFELPLKKMFIGYIANKSSIKRMQFNINPKSVWTDDSELLYVTADSRKLGKQMDADHEADDSKVTEMSLVVASLNAGGETFLYARLAFEALGRLASNGMHLLVLAFLSHLNINDDKTRKKSASFIYHILGLSIFNLMNGLTRVTDITMPILNLIRSSFKNLGFDTHDIDNSIEKFLPLSDSNVFNKLVESIISEINNNALKRKYSGLGAILVPSYHISQYFHLSGTNAGMTFLDIYNIASSNISKLKTKTTSLNGVSISQIGDSSKGLPEVKILHADNVNEYEIDVTNLQGRSLYVISLYLAAAFNQIPKLQKITFYTLNESNERLIVTGKLAYAIRKFGIKENLNDWINYVGINENAYKNALVESYLLTEQNRLIYYHDATDFIPSDNVDVVYKRNGKLQIDTISLDSLPAYYEFKHAFNKNNIDALAHTIRDLNNTLSGDDLLNFIDENFGKIIIDSGVYSGLLPSELYDADYATISSTSQYKLILKFIRLSLYDFKLRENITKPKDLRPQRITFKTKDGLHLYNIFDLDVVRNRYFLKADPSKNFIWTDAKNRFVGLDENLLFELSQQEIRKLNSSVQSISVKINGDDVEIDPLSINNEAAEIAVSNIHKTEFNQDNKTLAEIEKEFSSQKPKAIRIKNADFVLLSTKSDIGLICHEDSNIEFDDNYSRIKINEDIIQLGDKYVIYAIDKNFKPKYQIGILSEDNAVQLIDGEFYTKAIGEGESQKLNQDDYTVLNGKIYKKEYYIKKYNYSNGKTKKKLLYIDTSNIKDDNINDFIAKTIREISKQDNYGSIQLNGYFDYNNRDNIKDILNNLQNQNNTLLDEEFNISVLTAKTYLDYLDAKDDNGSIKNNIESFELIDDTDGKKIFDIYKNKIKYKKQNGVAKTDDYLEFLNDLNRARIAYQKGHFELSKYILSARIPAQTLQSYMLMKVVAYIPVSTNQAMVSAFQTWLQGSDYDIDKAYLMSFQYDGNGHFVGWSNLFDYSTPETAVASLELPTGTGKSIKIVQGNSNTAISDLTNRILDLQDLIDNNTLTNDLDINIETDPNVKKGLIITAKSKDGKSLVLFKIVGSIGSKPYETNIDEFNRPENKKMIFLAMAQILVNDKNKDSFVLPENLTSSDKNSLESLGFNVDIVLNKITYDPNKKINTLKVLKIKLISKLLSLIQTSNKNNIIIKIARQDEKVAKLLQQLNDHENYEVPTKDIDAANKNFVASRIMLTVNNPANMLKAYSYITIKDLKKLANKTKSALTNSSLTSINPLTTAILQYANMDGKSVIGISAIGEKVYMGLSYYYDAGINSLNEDWIRYMQFFHTTSRINGRASGEPKLFIRTTKTDNTYRALSEFMSDSKINEFKQKLLLHKQIIDYCKKNNIPESDIQKIYKENYGLFTLADLIISLLLSAATDNAKELILTSLNCGQQMALLYLHMIILGYSLNDIVAFMDSDTVNIIDSIISSDIFNNRNTIYAYDIQNVFDYVIQNKNFGYTEELVNKLIELAKSEKWIDNDRKGRSQIHNLFDLLNCINLNNFYEFVDRLPYGLLKRKDNEKLFLDTLFRIKQSKLDIKTFLADLNDFIYIEQGSLEMSNLGTIMGVAKGLQVGYQENFELIAKIQNIFNRSINMFKYIDADNVSKYGLNKELILSKEEGQIKSWSPSLIKEILKLHPNYDPLQVDAILNKAEAQGILKQESADSYKANFELSKFLYDENYRKVAIDLYDIFKKQYNIFDVVYKIPQYRQALTGLAYVSGLLNISTTKSAIVNQVQKDVAAKNAPFKSYEITRAERYADDLLTFAWILNYTKTHPIVFLLNQNNEYMTALMDHAKSDSSLLISINNVSDLLSFKMWVESVLIPALKQGSACNLTIDGKRINIEDNNAFINHLLYTTDNGLIFEKMNFSMNDVNSNSRTLSTYAKVQLDFMRLDTLNSDLPVKLTDYFILYNLLVNHNLQGNDRMTNLFTTVVSRGDSILQDYYTYVAHQDAVIREMTPDQLTNYLRSELGYSDMDAFIRIAKKYSSNTTKHNNEYVILQEDVDTKDKLYLLRKSDRGRRSEYRTFTSREAAIYPWISSEQKVTRTRMRNLSEDGVMNIPTAGNKLSVFRKMMSNNIKDVIEALLYVIYARKMNVSIKC